MKETEGTKMVSWLELALDFEASTHVGLARKGRAEPSRKVDEGKGKTDGAGVQESCKWTPHSAWCLKSSRTGRPKLERARNAKDDRL